jgi:hypothetical protein
MEPAVNAVYLDTSILRQQPFTGLAAALRPLFDAARAGHGFKVFAPEVAVREALSRHARAGPGRSVGD